MCEIDILHSLFETLVTVEIDIESSGHCLIITGEPCILICPTGTEKERQPQQQNRANEKRICTRVRAQWKGF